MMKLPSTYFIVLLAFIAMTMSAAKKDEKVVDEGNTTSVLANTTAPTAAPSTSAYPTESMYPTPTVTSSPSKSSYPSSFPSSSPTEKTIVDDQRAFSSESDPRFAAAAQGTQNNSDSMAYTTKSLGIVSTLCTAIAAVLVVGWN